MKKFLIVILVIVLIAVAYVLGTKFNSKEVNVQNTVVQNTTGGTEADSIDYSDFVGEYQDSVSQRASINVEKNNKGGVKLTVTWPESASVTYVWEMNAKYDPATNKLVYTDCKKSIIENDKTDVEYSNGEGFFKWEDKKLKWSGAQEEACKECVFELIEAVKEQAQSQEQTKSKESQTTPTSIDTTGYVGKWYPVSAERTGKSYKLSNCYAGGVRDGGCIELKSDGTFTDNVAADPGQDDGMSKGTYTVNGTTINLTYKLGAEYKMVYNNGNLDYLSDDDVTIHFTKK